MAIRTINRGKKTASSLKLKESRKQVSDSIAEDKKVQEELNKQLVGLRLEIKKEANVRDRLKQEAENASVLFDKKTKELDNLVKEISTIKFQGDYEKDRSEKMKEEISQNIQQLKDGQKREIEQNEGKLFQQKNEIATNKEKNRLLEVEQKKLTEQVSILDGSLKQKRLEFENLTNSIKTLEDNKTTLQKDIEAKQAERINKEKLNEKLKEINEKINKAELELSSKKEEVKKIDKFIAEENRILQEKKQEQDRTDERQKNKEEFIKAEETRIKARAKALQKYFDQKDIKINVKL